MAGRIQTTLVGSLPRPRDLLDMMKAKVDGQDHDPAALSDRIRTAVQETVARQSEAGVDVVCDGEMSKTGFYTYVQERLSGFESRPDRPWHIFEAEMKAFPEYYEEYLAKYMLAGIIKASKPLVCCEPIKYVGEAALKVDLDNLRAALAGTPGKQAFVPSTAPSGVGFNDFYKSEEAYLFAVAEALRTEYRMIVDAGFLLQVDEPFIPDVFVDPTLTRPQQRRRAELFAASINHALEGIAPERVRLHTCYGINDGPRIHEAALLDFVDIMLGVNAGFYSFEAANPRHEHEYHVWETVKLPEGKTIIPGVVTHAGNTPEHPELVAERILRYANLVGRDNVMVAPDCGFSSQATYNPEVHPTVMWLRIAGMAEGARIASQKLWKHPEPA